MKNSVAGIEYRFEDPRLLEEALTHRSIGSGNNERLEFLGDSVLGMVISSRLFELHPRASEGDLTKMRARLVRGTTLAKIARDMDLGRQVMMEPGVMKSGGFRNTSILAIIRSPARRHLSRWWFRSVQAGHPGTLWG